MKRIVLAAIFLALAACSAAPEPEAAASVEIKWESLVNDDKAYGKALRACEAVIGSERETAPVCIAYLRAREERYK